jgi:hypothetical protein
VRAIPDPGFPGDDGAADPATRRALEAYAAQPTALHDPTLALIQDIRVLVPVVAVPRNVEPGAVEPGPAHDKATDMATVLMTGRDGRTALLAFTGVESLRRWDPEARPVPVPLRRAAEAAVTDRATALVLDVAGPALFAIEDDDLRSLADGQVLVEVNGRFGWARLAP